MPHVEIPQAEFKVRAINYVHRETIIGKNGSYTYACVIIADHGILIH
jgi:hypothetical protein